MAEPNLVEDERRQQPNGTGDQDDDESVDWKAKALEFERKYGTLLNEKKRSAEDRRKLADALKAWNGLAEKHGVEPEQLEAMLSRQSEQELKSAREKGEIDKLLADKDKKHQRELEAEREERAKKEKIINAVLIDETIKTELDKLKVIPALKQAAFVLHRAKAKIVEDPEATYGIRVVMQIGGDEMTVADYLKNWAANDPDAEAFLIGNESVGGGAPAGSRRGMVVAHKPRSKMSAAEKSAYIRNRGKVEYDKLPWA